MDAAPEQSPEVSQNDYGASSGPLFDPKLLFRPHVRLHGTIDNDMLLIFLDQMLTAIEGEGPIVVELMTSGGSADIALRMADQVRLCREYLQRELIFAGVTTVCSAGTVLMAAFPNSHRFLSRDARLLIHGRRIESEALPKGSLSAVLLSARAKLAEYEDGLKLEQQSYRDLIAGSTISEAEIYEKAETNWYLSAREAEARHLVARLF